MDEEAYLRQCIADLHQAYLRDAQPYIDRLCRIIERKPMPPIMVELNKLDPEMRAHLMRNTEQ